MKRHGVVLRARWNETISRIYLVNCFIFTSLRLIRLPSLTFHCLQSIETTRTLAGIRKKNSPSVIFFAVNKKHTIQWTKTKIIQPLFNALFSLSLVEFSMTSGGSWASSVKFYTNVTLRALSFSSETFRSNFCFVGVLCAICSFLRETSKFCSLSFIRHITNYIAHQGVSAELQNWNLFSSTMKQVAETKAAGEFKVIIKWPKRLEQTFRLHLHKVTKVFPAPQDNCWYMAWFVFLKLCAHISV